MESQNSLYQYFYQVVVRPSQSWGCKTQHLHPLGLSLSFTKLNLLFIQEARKNNNMEYFLDKIQKPEKPISAPKIAK